MKIYLSLVLILILAAASAPFLSLPLEHAFAAKESAATTDEPAQVTLLRTESGKRETMTMRDYLIGVAAAETSPSMELEALKAQIVASHSYYLYLQQSDTGAQDLTDDPGTFQGYADQKQLQQRWGDDFTHRYERIARAVDAVQNEILTYQGAPILASYHALSPGVTHSAADVWGKDLPYLRSVTAEGDSLSPKLVSVVTLSKEDFKAKAGTLPGCSLEKIKKWVGKRVADETGLVKKIRIGSGTYDGSAVRAAFGLESACFTLKQKDDSFVFTVKGSGHGVGMSQNSADFMARQGSDYKEILAHFYPGTKLTTAA